VDPHPSTAGLAGLGIGELSSRYQTGELDATTVVEGLLERIAAVDAPGSGVELRAIAAVSSDALEQARRLDAERAARGPRGPLHGVPVLVKDNIEVAGLPGAAGSSALVGRPCGDAALVTRLREAGCVILGSTNLSAWANIRSSRSTSGWSATGGLVGNPWALDRSAGGSSSGAGASLAAGFTPFAVGTETDGSIVCPASLNGVVGLKPTVGTVPTGGIVPISSSQDSPGPMVRSARDLSLALSVLAGRTIQPTTEPLRWAASQFAGTGHPGTDAAFEQAVSDLTSAGLVIERRFLVPTPGSILDDALTVLLAELSDDLSAYLAARGGEGPRNLEELVRFGEAHREVELPYFGQEFFERAVTLGGRAGPAYEPARSRSLEWAQTVFLGPALDDVDVLVAPAYGPAWKSDLTLSGHWSPTGGQITTAPAIAGWPIASVPLGLVDGLPVGMAIVARPGREDLLLGAALTVEQALGGPLPPPAWRPPQRG